jgi:hypothetical protein
VPSRFSSTRPKPAAGCWVNLMRVQSSEVGSGWTQTDLRARHAAPSDSTGRGPLGQTQVDPADSIENLASEERSDGGLGVYCF